jgi:hypothetical protein
LVARDLFGIVPTFLNFFWTCSLGANVAEALETLRAFAGFDELFWSIRAALLDPLGILTKTLALYEVFSKATREPEAFVVEREVEVWIKTVSTN